MNNKVESMYEIRLLITHFAKLIFTPAAATLMTTLYRKFSDNKNLLSNIDMNAYRQLTPEGQDEFITLLANEMKKPKENNGINNIVFTVNDEIYEVRHNIDSGHISIAHHTDDIPFPVINETYLQPVSKDIEIIKKTLNNLSNEIEAIHYAESPYYHPDRFYHQNIAHYSFGVKSIYMNKEFQKLLNHFKSIFDEIFDERDQQIIDQINNDYFIYDKSFIETDMVKYFKKWFNKLKKGKHTSDNPLEFNDCDNYAYFKKSKTHTMVVQESQNTIFAYIMDLNTLTIKVWNCAEVNYSDYTFNEIMKLDNYSDAMAYINKPYSYYDYPFEIMGESYTKSANYYFEHFDNTDCHLVFDSNRGFNSRSIYSDCMATDIPLLLNVLKDI